MTICYFTATGNSLYVAGRTGGQASFDSAAHETGNDLH